MDPPPSPPGYRILAPIAKGGMAEVWLAERAAAGGVSKIVALKWVRSGERSDSEYLRLFIDEARLAVDLTHANIVQVIDLGLAGDRWFMAMEYVRGHSLAAVLAAAARRRAPLPAGVALFIAAEVSKALAYAHEAKGRDGSPLLVVHRDVSPANVLISTEGEVKLADFGIARIGPTRDVTGGGWVKGKIPYMAPEQARGAVIDARTDIYALGVVLYETATAERFVAPRGEVAMLQSIIAGTRPSFERLPAPLASVLERAVAFDPARRFPTARAMGQALREALASIAPALSSEEVRRCLADLDLPEPIDPARARAEAPEPIPLPAAPVIAEAPAPPPRDTQAGSESGPRRFVLPAAVAVIGLVIGLAIRLAVPRAVPETRLEVRAEPPGAAVAVDGIDRGPAPIVIRGLTGRVEIRITAPGHAAAVLYPDLAATPDAVIDVALGPAP